MKMIEKVAKAILETPNASDYETLVARNAIKAMLEPTQEMLNAGIRYGVEVGFGVGCDDYKELYQAMLEAALGINNEQ